MVSGGLIGDALDATTFQAATVSGSSATGWLAADGAINVANPSSITGVGRYANLLGSANGSVLNAIFTDSSLPLSFDSGGTLHGLALILADLAKITVAAGKLSGTVP